MSFDMGSYLGLRPQETLKNEILKGVKNLGGAYAEASYSGGNDEGGVDGVRIFRPVTASDPKEKISQVYRDDKYVELVDVTPPHETFGWNHPLWNAFQDLLGHEFGSWAGDFSASGSVFVDVSEKRIWRTGEVSTYESDETAGEY